MVSPAGGPRGSPPEVGSPENEGARMREIAARPILVVASLVTFAVACGERSSRPAGTPTAAPARVVFVVVTPTSRPEAEPTWTPEPEMVAALTPSPRATDREPGPSPRPTIDIASIPSLEHSVADPSA